MMKFNLAIPLGKQTTPKEYIAWCNMKARCYNKNYPQYKDYGGRGILVCKEWRYNFQKFYLDMGKSKKFELLDRIDNNKGYSKKNCRWTTRKIQNNNQRIRKDLVSTPEKIKKVWKLWKIIKNQREIGRQVNLPYKFVNTIVRKRGLTKWL